MRPAILLALLTSPALAECPAAPDRTEELMGLFAEVRAAETERAATQINNRMWEVYADAPDEAAQEILDAGMRRRASYDFAGAIAEFDRLVAYCPDYWEGYNQRAFVHFIRQDYDAALTDLEQTIALQPNHMGAQAGLALTLMGLGREAEGQAALRAALQIHPWLPERHLLKDDDTF